MNKDKLFSKIYQNLLQDREKLSAFYEKLVNLGTCGDPDLLVNTAEGIAKLSAELTRNNQQVIELYKLKIKEAPKEEEEPKATGTDIILDEVGENLDVYGDKH